MFNFCGLILANLCLLYDKYGILNHYYRKKCVGGCIPSAPPPPPVAAGPVVQFLWVDFSYFMPALWQIWYFKNHHFRKVGGGGGM